MADRRTDKQPGIETLAADLASVRAQLDEMREALIQAWEYLAHDEPDAAAVVIEAALAAPVKEGKR